jgi:hypothetical protein
MKAPDSLFLKILSIKHQLRFLQRLQAQTVSVSAVILENKAEVSAQHFLLSANAGFWGTLFKLVQYL